MLNSVNTQKSVKIQKISNEITQIVALWAFYTMDELQHSATPTVINIFMPQLTMDISALKVIYKLYIFELLILLFLFYILV